MSKPKGFRGFRYIANRSRARLLKNRGEQVWWSDSHQLWVWRPKQLNREFVEKDI